MMTGRNVRVRRYSRAASKFIDHAGITVAWTFVGHGVWEVLVELVPTGEHIVVRHGDVKTISMDARERLVKNYERREKASARRDR